jgi:uncharacterized protein YdbL (DUF1318 family)
MNTTEQLYPMWLTVDHVYVADMNQARHIEYKYVIKSSHATIWEDKSHPAAVTDD